MSPQGNTRLVEYGIQNDGSDFRIHVAFLARKCYTFPTPKAVEAIERGDYPYVPVYTDGIMTAKGHLVPPSDIDGCIETPIPRDVYFFFGLGSYPEYGYCSEKGRAATYVANVMCRRGLIAMPISFQAKEIDELAMQIRGIDIQAKAKIGIQVKCDYRAGNGEHPRCTGNLFLQGEECNPNHIT